MAGIFLGLDTDPALIADALGSTLNGVFASASGAATQLTRHAQGFSPAGIPGVVHVPYKFILIILGSIARVDGSALLGGFNPLRGTLSDAWSLDYGCLRQAGCPGGFHPNLRGT